MGSKSDNNVLVRTYRSYIGPGTPEQAIGYWLVAIGAIAGLVGILSFLYSTTLDDHFAAREVAVVLSAVGLMLILLGTVYRLPVKPRVRWVAIVGAAITVITTLGFIVVYPGDWDAGADYSTELISLYGLGIGLVVVAALVLPPLTKSDPETPSELVERATPSKATFELYTDAADNWRWRLRHQNGNIIAAAGQGYSSKQKAKQGLESVRSNAVGSPIEERLDPTDTSQASFEVYEDSAGEWRWRLRHDNGNIIADSGEGYADRSSVDEAIERVQSYAATADVLRLETGAFDVFQDAADEWRWRLLAPNGRIIADSGEGYASRSNALAAIDRIRDIDSLEFDIYEDASDRYRWRLLAGNNEIVADSGQSYSRRDGASNAVDRVREYAPVADVLTITGGAFDVYRDRGDEWRWRLLASNGAIVADSGEGYSSRAGVRNGLESVQRNAPSAPVETVE